jgi:hypothetical protein
MDNENRIADLVLEISRKLKQEAQTRSSNKKLKQEAQTRSSNKKQEASATKIS